MNLRIGKKRTDADTLLAGKPPWVVRWQIAAGPAVHAVLRGVTWPAWFADHGCSPAAVFAGVTWYYETEAECVAVMQEIKDAYSTLLMSARVDALVAANAADHLLAGPGDVV